MNRHPKIVFCADDFTGASDTLATLSKAGLNTRLYLQAPKLENNPEVLQLDAIGVATSLRAQSSDTSSKTMLKVAESVSKLNADFYHFKVCSTFDSSLITGNIASTSNVFATAIKSNWTIIIGGQPSLGRYCIFGHLFATAGADSVYRIDRHPLMKQHPITPMTESDLSQHLQHQGMHTPGLVSFTDYAMPFDSLVEKIRNRIDEGETHTLFDASSNADVIIIGKLLRKLSERYKILSIGASSVAEALAKNPDAAPYSLNIPPTQDSFSQNAKPVLAIAGSRSSITERQIQNAQHFKKIALSLSIICTDIAALQNLAENCINELRNGQHLLLHLEANAVYSLSGPELAAQMAKLVKLIVEEDVVGLLAIAGGDTSSLALQVLAPDSLSFISDFEKGAPLIQAHSKDATLELLPMVLKGGQMGSIEFFDRTVELPRREIPSGRET